ncbi:DUF6090 family protein [uncultured Acetobacteroides sp.]|uniref:DUF6090 family protein n=1 Tax=uncultured Acetobacteroides sp. TaxID=1760811 RepID=UPI0029F55F54|nr:DUF6090 family protein [uncultured Acetobacteroides sp.]
MQEEVKKHTNKIFKVANNSSYSFSKKVKEVLIEILIIVFAVSISIYLHGWSAHRHEQKEVKVFLTNLREDLIKDINTIKYDKNIYLKINKQSNDVLKLKASQFDSIARTGNKVDIPLHIFGSKINNGNYEGFKTSGKIGYIENEKLKQMILAYYQTDVLNIGEMDRFYAQYVVKTIDSQVDYVNKTDKEKYLDPIFREKIGLLIGLGENNIEQYNYIITNISKIVKEVEKELNK